VLSLAVCAEGLRVCPDDAELLFLRGVLLQQRGDLAGARDAFSRLLSPSSGNHFASVADGLRGYQARHNLGVICRQQGEVEQAEEYLRAALAERPDLLRAWRELAELYLEQGRWAELDAALTALQERGAGQDAAVLRARGHLARQDFAAARVLLEETIERLPQALGPRVILSHALLQEGTDLDAAEQALRSVLALAPTHAEARNNLAVLRRQRQRLAEEALQALAANNLGGVAL
jgi:Tfp pilus assembly protein PilF